MQDKDIVDIDSVVSALPATIPYDQRYSIAEAIKAGMTRLEEFDALLKKENAILNETNTILKEDILLLKKQNELLLGKIKHLEDRICDRQRIAKLETSKAGQKTKDQIASIEAPLQESPGHVASFGAIRKHLGVSKPRFSAIIKLSGNLFIVMKSPHNPKKKLLKLAPKI